MHYSKASYLEFSFTKRNASRTSSGGISYAKELVYIQHPHYSGVYDDFFKSYVVPLFIEQST